MRRENGHVFNAENNGLNYILETQSDIRERTVKLMVSIALTKREMILLNCWLHAQVFSREHIYERVWDMIPRAIPQQ